MIIIIQAAVIMAALFLFFFALRSNQTHAGRAWKKIALCFLAIGMVVAVLFPESTNEVAHVFGVGRGADLLLYMLTLAFITRAVSEYLQQQRDRDALHRLARKVALLDATERYNLRKK